ncbi:MAG: ABC transporter permease [Leucobacter sp.]
MKPGYFSRIASTLLAVFLVVPTVIVISTSFTSGRTIIFPPQGFSFRWYEEVLSTERWTGSFMTSIQVGAIAALIAMVLGSFLAIGAARGRGILPGWTIVALAVSPMVVPTVVSGLGYYVTGAAIGLVGTPIWLAVAHALMGMPFVFINVLASLGSITPSVEEAAQVCGASPAQTLLRITLPLVTPSVIVGGVLAFISSFDEVIVASFLTSPTFRTLPVNMFSDVQGGAEPSTSAVAGIVTAASFVLLTLIAAAPLLKKNKKKNNVLVSKEGK